MSAALPGAPTLTYDSSKTEQTLRVGSRCLVEIDVSGLPLPTITWKKDGQPIEDTSILSVRDDFTSLSIPKVKDSDTGMYTITAENSVGRATATFDVEIKGK